MFLLALLLLIPSAQNCAQRDYGYGGTVCVCNATYCDWPALVPNLSETQFAVFTSSRGGLRFDFSLKEYDNEINPDVIQFSLDYTASFQKVEGFGGAFTDSTGINVRSLSPKAQENLINTYFSQKGISYTIGRVPMAGSDFSLRPYAYNENTTDLSNFALTEEDFLYKIPLIKRAMTASEGSLRIIAAAWSAPPWMKTNNDYVGIGSLKKEFYSTWSEYHMKFLEAYQENDIEVWCISTGNEPLNGDIPLYPFNCMGWTPYNQRLWIEQHLGPSLRNSPFNRTKILAYDDQRFELPAWLKIEFGDGNATEYIAGIGVHWYWDNIAPIDFLDKAHNLLPDKFILGTEACFTKKPQENQVVHLGSWQRGEVYAESIIDDMNHWVAGWVDWNLALDLNGGPNWAENFVDAPVIVNSTADEFYKQPMFYALGHFSKFVPVGSYRIGLAGGTSAVKGIAFITPENSTVVVLLNKNENVEKITIKKSSTLMNIELPSKSISTIVSE